MVAYSFKRRFVPPIVDGRKRQTIRTAGLKRHARPGEQLQLYTEQRTKNCQLIGLARCVSVERIDIDVRRWLIMLQPLPRYRHEHEWLDYFARCDGFDNRFDMREFWIEVHGDGTFSGVLITWDELILSAPMREDHPAYQARAA